MYPLRLACTHVMASHPPSGMGIKGPIDSKHLRRKNCTAPATLLRDWCSMISFPLITSTANPPAMPSFSSWSNKQTVRFFNCLPQYLLDLKDIISPLSNASSATLSSISGETIIVFIRFCSLLASAGIGQSDRALRSCIPASPSGNGFCCCRAEARC